MEALFLTQHRGVLQERQHHQGTSQNEATDSLSRTRSSEARVELKPLTPRTEAHELCVFLLTPKVVTPRTKE